MLFFVLLFTLTIFVGCGEQGSALYFSFCFDSLTLEVGENFNVFDKEIDSNFLEYAQMHIYSSDDSVAKVNGSVITVKKAGTSTITVSGLFGGVFVSDSFIVNAIERTENSENDGNNSEEGGGNNSEEQSGENNGQGNNENNNQNENGNDESNTWNEESNTNNDNNETGEESNNENIEDNNEDNGNNSQEEISENNWQENNENGGNNKEESGVNNENSDQNENGNDDENTGENVELEELTIANYEEMELSDRVIYDFEVKLNGEDYNEFKFEIISGEENLIKSPYRINNKLEFVCTKNSSIIIKIYDSNESIFITARLPNFDS